MTDPAGNASSTVGLRQPLLLRLLHAAAVLAVFAAWLSGLVSALRHDGRLAALHLQAPGEWLELHSAIGEITTPIALLFGLYAITVGRWRLRRPSNAAALLALALAVGSGQFMDEDWLLDGRIHHPLYSLHLTAWLIITAVVSWHVFGVLRRGGRSLAASMLPVQPQTPDRPAHPRV